MYQSCSDIDVDYPREIKQHCEEHGLTTLSATLAVDEEQERELSHELEPEREVERPPAAEPAEHSIHLDVENFVDTGRINMSSLAFTLLFTPLKNSNPNFRSHSHWSSRLRATKDYERTVVLAGQQLSKIGDYMRPLNWIMSSSKQDVLVALSPHEVNSLLPKIRNSQKVRLHQYAPRVTKEMKPFDDLSFNPIPPLPKSRPWSWKINADDMAQINLWAGQLYFTDYEASHRLRTILGLSTPETDAQNVVTQLDGWISQEERRDELRDLCRFEDNPIQMLKEHISLRRKGMGYEGTQLGRILRGQKLDSDDLDFAT
jgi:hypothetical protein